MQLLQLIEQKNQQRFEPKLLRELEKEPIKNSIFSKNFENFFSESIRKFYLTFITVGLGN